MSKAHDRVLVLNNRRQPIDIVSVGRAVSMVTRKRAWFLDAETSITYEYPEWVKNWNDAKEFIKTGSIIFSKPEVIVLRQYSGLGFNEKPRNDAVKFSRFNVYLRDKHKCQYCGKKFETKDLNLDHVVPKSRGGAMSWFNIVLSCIPCNDKKRDRTPEEAGMKLIRKPYQPTQDEVRVHISKRLRAKLTKNMPVSWATYIDTQMTQMYWNVELKD